MAYIKHSELSLNSRHALHSYEYTNEAARLAANSFTINDKGKIAQQKSDDTFQVLKNIDPVQQIPFSSVSSDSTNESSTITQISLPTMIQNQIEVITHPIDTYYKRSVNVVEFVPGASAIDATLDFDLSDNNKFIHENNLNTECNPTGQLSFKNTVISSLNFLTFKYATQGIISNGGKTQTGTDSYGPAISDPKQGIYSGKHAFEAVVSDYFGIGIAVVNENTVDAQSVISSISTGYNGSLTITLDADLHELKTYNSSGVLLNSQAVPTLSTGECYVIYAYDGITGGPERSVTINTGQTTLINPNNCIPSEFNKNMKAVLHGFVPNDANVITTSNVNHLLLENISNFTSCVITETIPVGTSILYAVSFDGRNTQKKWNGTSWIDIANVESGQISSQFVQGFINLDASELSLLDIGIALQTNNSIITPSVNQITFNYMADGSYKKALDADYKIEYINSLQTKITKLSSGTKDYVKINVSI